MALQDNSLKAPSLSTSFIPALESYPGAEQGNARTGVELSSTKKRNKGRDTICHIISLSKVTQKGSKNRATGGS